jgi:hypothetical protein
VLAKDAFSVGEELFTRRFSVTLNRRMVKVLMWPFVLHGCEALVQDKINRLKVIEKDKLDV